MSYGLPRGTRIAYGQAGFPAWVYELADRFGVRASTYKGHQETDRAEQGFAPNPQRLNRGIDWAGPVDAMQRFADYLLTVREHLEQVIWENPRNGRRVGVAGGRDVTTSAYYAYDGGYNRHRNHVHTRQSQPIPQPTSEAPVPDNRPDFNEWPMWSPSHSSRGSTKIDAFFLHTQEGGGGDSAAENLAKYLGNPANKVSYHYTVSQASDGGVTVVDVVDTDYASWSVLSANSRSINLCFAGSRASWTREQWLKQSKAIDAAAYLAVQDCKKYDFATRVIAPPYSTRLPGLSDHAYVTKVLGDGTHTDVGPNFPWDYFSQRVTFWEAGGKDSPTPQPAPVKVWPKDYSDRELLVYVAEQLGAGRDDWGEDGDLGRNAKGQRRTLRAGIAALLRGQR